MTDDVSPYAEHEFASGSHNNSWANLFDFIPSGARVLDVGCSTGNFGAALIAYKSCTVVGIDTNEADIALARAVLTDARVLDVTEPGAVDALGLFDVIVFADVLEHLPSPRVTLKSLRTALSPEGFVAFSIPNMGHLSVRLDLLAGQFAYTETGLLDRTHLHFYDTVEITQMFAEGGFEIADQNPVIVQYPDTWLVDRLGQLGLAASSDFFALMLETEGQVFQYVGIARPADTDSLAITPRIAGPMPIDEIIGYVQALIDEKTRAEERAADLEERFRSAQQHPMRYLIRRLARLARRSKLNP